MGLRSETLTRGARKGETVMLDPPQLDPGEAADRAKMRVHVKNGWSFYVGRELYVLMDYKGRGTVYMKQGRRFSQNLGSVWDMFPEQLKEPKKVKKEDKK